MRLASLTLQGFKSFGNRVSIEFAPGVTAIIGPNGSGKSNVIDALKWTTGGGRAREFRAADKTDLIFHGASGKRSVGLAEVEVELRDGSRSVKVYRSLDRDGVTRLRLGGRPARLLDVEEALTGSGLGRSGVAIIGQGEVSQVLMADPEKLLEYVAEAAGVARLSGRREQTTARLETAGHHLARLQDVLVELSARRAALAVEAQAAKRHASLSAEQLALRFTLAHARVTALVAELRELDEKRGLLEAALLDGRERLEALREATRAAARLRDEAEERHREAATQLEYRRGNLRVAEERLARLAERATSMRTQSAAARAELERLEGLAPPKRPEEEPAAAQERAATAQALAREAEEALAAAAVLEGRRREEHERLRQRHAVAEREAAGAAQARASLLAQAERVAEQLASLAQAADEVDLPSLMERQAAAAALLSRVEAQVEAQRAALQRVHEEHALLAAEAVSRHHAANRSRAALEARKGYAQGPRNALTSGIPGVIGAVADLVKVAPQHQEAIAGALGRRAEYVVVDDARTGEAVLDHVRRAGGFVTVLPLDLLRAPHDRGGAQLAGRPGVIAPALDLASFDAKYATLFEFLLGGTVVVDTLASATAIARRDAHRPRMVTLGGDVVEPSGAMSGGKRSQHAAVLGAAADLEQAEAAASAAAAAAEEGSTRLVEAQALMRELLAAQRAAAEENRAAAQALAAAREERAGHERLVADLLVRKEELAAELAALPETASSGQQPGHADLTEALAAAEVELAAAVTALEAARTLAASRKAAAADARQAAALAEERWRVYAEAEVRYAASSERAAALRDELEALREREAALGRELVEATAARDLAKAAVPESLAAEEAGVAGARQALAAAEASLTRETEAQARRAQELEEAKVQAARRDTGLELAQEELRGFPPGTPSLEVSERAARARLREVSDELAGLGAVNHRAVAELEEVTERNGTLEAEVIQASLAVAELQAALERIDKETTTRLGAALQRLQESFGRHVRQLFGNDARGGIEVELEGARPVGLRIRLQPPGKQTHSLHLLSVGERTMGALAFLFSLMADEGGGLPVAVLDEVDAPLDEANIRRYGSFVQRLAQQGTQFVLITHQKATFEIAETLWGVTTEQGVSRVFSIRREEAPQAVGAAVAAPG